MRRLVTFFLVIGLLGALAAPAAARSPTTTEQAGLRVTYVPTDEPGVYEVISEPHKKWLNDGVLGPLAVDPDGAVWIQGWAGKDEDVLYVAQVGVPGRTRFGKIGRFWYVVDDLEFSADGTLWGASARLRLRSLDGDTWTVHPIPAGIAAGTEVTDFPDEYAGDEDYGVVDLTLAPDGVLYGISERQDLIRIADGKVSGRALGLSGTGPATALAVTPDGTIWVGGGGPSLISISTDDGWLVRHDGASSERVRPLGDAIDPRVADLAVGPDGALWVLMRTEDDSYLGRYDGESWSMLSTADGLPAVGAWYDRHEGMAYVDADAVVWNVDLDPGLWTERTLRRIKR